MRIIFPVLLALLAGSCDNTTRQTATSDSLSSSAAAISAAPNTDYTPLLEKFPLTSFDTLEVESPDIEENTSPFMGVALDTSLYKLIPKDISLFEGVYTISKFTIDNDNTGLLIRAGGEYVASAIYLLIYNRPSNSLNTSGGMLADTWGDAGDSEIRSSWLMYKREQPLLKLLRRDEGHDNSVANEQDTTYESKTDYYLMKVGFKGEDTVSKNNTELLRTFGHLLNPAQPPAE